MSDEKIYSWEPPVYIKGTSEELLNEKERFRNLQGGIGRTRTEVACYVWHAGMLVMENDPDIINKIDGGTLAITEAFNEVINQKVDTRRLKIIFDKKFSYDSEKFYQWCSDKNIPLSTVEDVLDACSFEQPSWHDNAVSWLKTKVLSDKKSHRTSEIRERAVVEGIIGTSEREWHNLCQLAWGERLTTRSKGVWQLTG